MVRRFIISKKGFELLVSFSDEHVHLKILKSGVFSLETSKLLAKLHQVMAQFWLIDQHGDGEAGFRLVRYFSSMNYQIRADAYRIPPLAPRTQ